jgi:hypothetical protein
LRSGAEFPDRRGFASSGDGQTLFRVPEDGFDLRAGYAGEPFEEVVDSCAVFDVGEEGLDGTRVPRKTHAPLTVSAFRSTAGQALQSSMAKG